MNKSIFQTLALFVLLAIVQVLVCNNISILNFATPFVFIYVIVRLPLTLHRNWVMIIGFLAGLIIDIFGDTAGMNALACTILGAVRETVVKLYVTHDDEIADPVPSAKTLRTWRLHQVSADDDVCLLSFGDFHRGFHAS